MRIDHHRFTLFIFLKENIGGNRLPVLVCQQDVLHNGHRHENREIAANLPINKCLKAYRISWMSPFLENTSSLPNILYRSIQK